MSFFEYEHSGIEINPRSWKFWRTCIIFFCAFSFIGHTIIEWPYCALGATLFNSVSWEDEVLASPFKPFFVYGVGALVCYVLLVPLKRFIANRVSGKWAALAVFYVISVFLGMAGELTQGFLQNQPVNGVYPLWDVHDYPGNILGQAWIVNDVLLGVLITVAAWHIVPKCLRMLEKLTERQANILAFFITAIFAALVLVTYP